MRWLNVAAARLRALVRREAVLRDVDDELRSHVEMEKEANIARGMTPEDAEREALRSFGNMGRFKDLAHEIRGGGFVETLMQDLRYGARTLWRSPGFTAVAVLTLALGIGANTAIFSVVNSLLLRPLPYAAPERLVWLWATLPQLDQAPFAPVDFLGYQASNNSFERMAALRPMSFNLTGGAQPERIEAAIVSADYFALLGVSPLHGRTFMPEDGRAGAARAAVLSYSFWRRRFGGDPHLIGTALTLSGESVTVVGIMPPDFKPDRAEFWVNPRQVVPDFLLTYQGDPRTMHAGYLRVIARLRPGVTLSQAQADIDTIAARLQAQHPGQGDHAVRLVALHERVVGDIRPALLVLLGAVGLVLLIACANVANLLLSRATVRYKELAVRAALGASRLRVIKQLLTESVLLAVAGGAGGWLLAFWGIRLLVAVSPAETPRLGEIGLDQRAFVFTLVVSLLTGVVFGLAPALAISRPGLNDALKEGGRSQPAGSGRHRMRSVLVVAEVALAVVVLIGAGLLVRSFARLQEVDPGFDPRDLLTMHVWLSDRKYEQPGPTAAFLKELVGRLEKIPGVRAVGVSDALPIRGTNISGNPIVEGRVPEAPGDQTLIGIHAVNPGYFHAMGIRLIKGRVFTDRDVEGAAPVAIVSEATARRLWPGEDPLGKRLKYAGTDTAWSEVVGVVGDVKYDGLDKASGLHCYAPQLQMPLPYMAVSLRSGLEDPALTAAVQREVQAMDSGLPVYEIKTMDEVISESIAPRRLLLSLFGLFAVVALTLTAVGIYGVVAYTAAQRTHEIGIRKALGARTSDVLKLIVGRGLLPVAVGLMAGSAAAFVLLRLITSLTTSLLFEVSAGDPMTFTAIASLLLLVALLACYIPARRATKVDPLVALRHE